MKRLTLCEIVTLLSWMVAFGQPVTTSDFRIPESKSENLFFNLQGFLNSSKGADGFRSDPGSSYDQKDSRTNANLDFSCRYYSLQFSENSSNELNLDGRAGYSFSKSDRTSVDTSVRNAAGQSNSGSLSISPRWTFSTYLEPDRWFLFGRVDGAGTLGFSGGESSENFQPTTATRGEFGGYDILGKFGLGFGKMRDGRVVFQVLRFLEKLEEDGSFTRSLEREEVLKIVNIFARKVEYSTSHERFVKYFFRDVFAELEAMGVIKEGRATAYSLVRSEEILSESIFTRLFGWRTQVGVQHSSFQRFSKQSNVPDYFKKGGQDFLSTSIEYGKDLSLNSHLYGRVSSDIPINSLSTKPNFDLTASLIYEVGEKIEVAFRVSYYDENSVSEVIFSDIEFSRSINRSVEANFVFYLEDHVFLDFTAGYHNRDFSTILIPSYSRSSSEEAVFGNVSIRYKVF